MSEYYFVCVGGGGGGNASSPITSMPALDWITVHNPEICYDLHLINDSVNGLFREVVLLSACLFSTGLHNLW